MFLAAEARPRKGMTGHIGIWPVVKSKTAKKASKNHDAGDEYDVRDTMTSAKYLEMMTKQVFPAIQKAFRGTGIKRVVVQQDGARPHTGKGNLKKLNDAGARLPIKLVVRTQPAQSPDYNICDLAFFRSLSTKIRKSRRGTSRKFDIPKLRADVEREYYAYPSADLEKMWAHKEYIMKAAAACGGGNDYERHKP